MSSESLRAPAGSINCDEIVALVPAYAIGATDPEETLLVEKHLADCPEAVAELSAYSEITEALLATSPVIAPPADLGARIVAASRGSSVPAQIIRPDFTLPPKTSDLRRWVWLVGTMTAAVAVLLIAANVVWISELRAVRQREDRLLRLLEEQNLNVASIGSGEARVAVLTSTAGQTDLIGTLVWNVEEQNALLYVSNLPDIPADRVYQLWLLAGDLRISGGVFRVDTGGMGWLRFQPDVAIENVQALGITAEPEGGSEAPTSDPILIGEI
jgi:anti-sigma-K factor RskA